MYLKNLEVIGFKSFADNILLEIGSGMTAIVGPNGCGKSNVSDAIRWVLGEQSAKLLRGSKMEDCIFNGTDERKPLGMAEVSLTLADCEHVLHTDYHEITVTRRVFRSGEGQYFINKTPCRLKDIQRLFMDTGIGTSSYSLMEQGRIDLILSSRPEDRREIFEEASGITKYKTDKREALRKLDQTEANLLRLADIIKEVKRQIISLQRQAGKASRVKKLKQELRSLDMFVSKGRLQTLSAELQRLETQMASLTETIEAFQKDISDLELKDQALRQALSSAESDMAGARQMDMDLHAQLDRTRQSIDINQRRIVELQGLIQRDSADKEGANKDITKQHRALEQTQQLLKKAQSDLASCEAELREKSQKNAAQEQALEQTKQAIQNLHTESMELDDKGAKLQNELHKMETEDRSVVSKRERCATEQANLKHILEGLEKRLAGFSEILKKLTADVQQSEQQVSDHFKEQSDITKTIKALEQERAESMALLASKEAQIQMLNTHLMESRAFSDGAKQLLDKSNPLGIDRTRLLGSLAEHIETEPEFREALKAVLRFWLDAVVVTDMAEATVILRRLEACAQGAAQLLAIDIPNDPGATLPAEGPGLPLISRVSCPKPFRPLIERLLAHVRVIDSLDDLPATLHPQAIFVTRQGTLVKGSGAIEYYRALQQASTPLSRQRMLQELTDAMAGHQASVQAIARKLAEQTARQATCNDALQTVQTDLKKKQQALARQEGEHQTVAKEANQFRERLETVSWEFQELAKQGSSVEARSAMITEMDRIRARRVEIKVTVDRQNQELQRLEQDHKRLLADVMEANVRVAKQKQTLEHLLTQHKPLADRIAEQESRITECSSRITGYQKEIDTLTKTIAEAQQQIPSLEDDIGRTASRLEDIRKRREAAEADWKGMEDKLKALRASLDDRRNQRHDINGRCIELRMKHQNLIERITSEYRISADAIPLEPEPEWPEGKPDMETLDNTIGELRAKIEAMGPVYEGAIEEYEQLQERFTFLNQQQDDLIKSKQQLMEMIKKINQTTTEMFAQTFEVINNNFQTMFKQLFGGGSAKLMLADEDDILESGIEIIARPPGKRLQSVSLLSGGERTLTAVALLFAIYMVKPSPFCVLDELDAALDEPNIIRFIKMLKGFLNQSQFIVITHNQQTIAAANVIYGVTMEETGVSKIVSMKFSEKSAQPAIHASEQPTAEPPPSEGAEMQKVSVSEPGSAPA